MMDASSVLDATLALFGAGAALFAGLCTMVAQSTTVSATSSGYDIYQPVNEPFELRKAA